MELNAKIFVAGHNGLVGSAICHELAHLGFKKVLIQTRQELDLLDQLKVQKFLANQKPEYIFVAAAKVGGIWANNIEPANFIYENLQIQNNLIEAARQQEVKKLLLLGSSCIYPKLASQPIKEEYLLTGPLEQTNQWYAIAKIAGIKLCQAYRRQYGCDFISAMPTNLYGPNDNYDLDKSHVLPALIRRFHEAKIRDRAEVVCWGTGEPLREFLFSSDLARALVFLMQNYSDEKIINVGSSLEKTICDLAEIVKDVIGFTGRITWDASKPDGTPRKLMDSSRLFAMGWRPQINLRQGIALAYADFLQRFPL
jgi:GDP-L-fucose synthase